MFIIYPVIGGKIAKGYGFITKQGATMCQRAHLQQRAGAKTKLDGLQRMILRTAGLR